MGNSGAAAPSPSAALPRISKRISVQGLGTGPWTLSLFPYAISICTFYLVFCLSFLPGLSIPSVCCPLVRARISPRRSAASPDPRERFLLQYSSGAALRHRAHPPRPYSGADAPGSPRSPWRWSASVSPPE